MLSVNASDLLKGTTITVKNLFYNTPVRLKYLKSLYTELSYITDYVNKMAMEGTAIAHVDGGVPNIRVTIPEISAYEYGYMVYFFELACGVSAYTEGVNPFNQPGVELYKKNMFGLLGKPGYEDLKAELDKKLK